MRTVELQELSRHERGRLWVRMGIRTALAALAVGLCVWVLPPLLSLFMPFVLALLLSWLLNPMVKGVQKRWGGSRKALSLVLILLLFGVAGGALAALGYSVISELVSLANNWQGIWSGVVALIDSVGTWLSGLFEYLPPEVETTAAGVADRLIDWVQNSVSALLNAAASGAGSFAMSVPSFAVAAVVFVMASYFITSDYPRLRELVTSRMSLGVRSFLSQVKRAAVAGFGGYIRAQLILATVVFFILLAGFLIIRQPYAVLLAFLLAVLDFIPIVGSGTVMVPWAVISLLTREFAAAAELMVIWGVIAVFRQVAEPRIVGNQTGLSPIASLISIYVGMRLAGVPGMILGPVTCMVVVNICRLGVFDGAISDLRLAVRDLSALLKNRPPVPDGGEPPEEPPGEPPEDGPAD